MATETSEGSVEAYTELEHFQRLQPPRERASDAGAALIGAFAIVFGLAAFYFSPLKLGVLAIALAIVAMGVSGGRNTTARVAMIVSTLGFTVGVLLAILTDNSPLK